MKKFASYLDSDAWFQHRMDSSESSSTDDAAVAAEADTHLEEKAVPEASSDSQTDQSPAADVNSDKSPESESGKDAAESKTDDAAQARCYCLLFDT